MTHVIMLIFDCNFLSLLTKLNNAILAFSIVASIFFPVTVLSLAMISSYTAQDSFQLPILAKYLAFANMHSNTCGKKKKKGYFGTKFRTSQQSAQFYLRITSIRYSIFSFSLDQFQINFVLFSANLKSNQIKSSSHSSIPTHSSTKSQIYY